MDSDLTRKCSHGSESSSSGAGLSRDLIPGLYLLDWGPPEETQTVHAQNAVKDGECLCRYRYRQVLVLPSSFFANLHPETSLPDAARSARDEWPP